jgi:hypothetical protein
MYFLKLNVLRAKSFGQEILIKTLLQIFSGEPEINSI